MQDYAGQQLDNYLLLSQLGTGSTGQVYLAEHVRTKEQVAVKILSSPVDESWKLFLTEARTMRLRHPHILPIIDFGVHEHIPFIVMEYARFGTLRHLHARGDIVEQEQVLSYVVQIASALQFAHNDGIIHRDIKPSNIAVTGPGQVALSDFGIAVIQLQDNEITQSLIGTIYYMAPEQAQGRAGPASDQYALAVVIYEWLCGVPPFEGKAIDIMIQHRLDEPPSICARNPAIPVAVERVLFQALAKDPAKRFASVDAFATALQKAYSHPLEPEAGQGQKKAQEETQEEYNQQPQMLAIHPSMAQDVVIPPLSSVAERISAKLQSQRPAALSVKQKVLPGGYAIALLIAISILVGATITYVMMIVQAPISSMGSPQNAVETPSAYELSIESAPVHGAYDVQHTGYNQYEEALSASSIEEVMPLWRSQVLDGDLSRTPVVAHGMVFVGTEDGVYAFDEKSCGEELRVCQPLWIGAVPEVIFPVAVTQDHIFVSAKRGVLAVFDVDGCGENQTICQPLWYGEIPAEEDESPSPPMVADGIAYVTHAGRGEVYAFRAEGCGQMICQPLWSIKLEPFILGNLAYENGVFYVASQDRIYAFNASVCEQDGSSCQPLWYGQMDSYIFSDVVVADGMVYAGSPDGSLMAFPAEGCGQEVCQPRWSFRESDADFGGGISSAYGLVFATFQNSDSSPHPATIHVFDANACSQQQTSCTPAWSIPLDGTVVPLTIANGLLYVSILRRTTGDDMFAFPIEQCQQSESCQPVWSYDLGAPNFFISAPVVVDGMIYTCYYSEATERNEMQVFGLPVA